MQQNAIPLPSLISMVLNDYTRLRELAPMERTAAAGRGRGFKQPTVFTFYLKATNMGWKAGRAT